MDHYCCTTYAADPVEESSFLSVSWINGAVISTLVDGDWMDVELDAAGRTFLLMDTGGDVHTWDGSGDPAFVAGGFEDVAW